MCVRRLLREVCESNTKQTLCLVAFHQGYIFNRFINIVVVMYLQEHNIARRQYWVHPLIGMQSRSHFGQLYQDLLNYPK